MRATPGKPSFITLQAETALAGSRANVETSKNSGFVAAAAAAVNVAAGALASAAPSAVPCFLY